MPITYTCDECGTDLGERRSGNEAEPFEVQMEPPHSRVILTRTTVKAEEEGTPTEWIPPVVELNSLLCHDCADVLIATVKGVLKRGESA